MRITDLGDQSQMSVPILNTLHSVSVRVVFLRLFTHIDPDINRMRLRLSGCEPNGSDNKIEHEFGQGIFRQDQRHDVPSRTLGQHYSRPWKCWPGYGTSDAARRNRDLRIRTDPSCLSRLRAGKDDDMLAIESEPYRSRNRSSVSPKRCQADVSFATEPFTNPVRSFFSLRFTSSIER